MTHLLDDAHRTGSTGSRHQGRGRRALVVLSAALVLGGGALGVYGLQERYDSRIERFPDPFQAIPDSQRPPEATEPGTEARTAEHFLLVGSDSRISAGDPAQWQAGAQRTDAIMVVHLPADRSAVYVVSLPRDSWVPVPDHGTAKVNAAYSYGGPPLLIRTVEQLIGVRIDHLAVVDFEGFQAMTDALGGVTIDVADDAEQGGGQLAEGPQRMSGEQALDYVRERYSLPGGDLDRARRQQNWIRAVLTDAVQRDVLTDPARLDAFLLATTSAVALDEGFGVGELRDLALSMRSLGREDVVFLTAPVAGLGRSADGQSIVRLDELASQSLWQAMREGTMSEWVASHPDLLLGDRVR